MKKLIKAIEAHIDHSLPPGIEKIKITSSKRQILSGVIDFEYKVNSVASMGKIEISCYA